MCIHVYVRKGTPKIQDANIHLVLAGKILVIHTVCTFDENNNLLSRLG